MCALRHSRPVIVLVCRGQAGSQHRWPSSASPTLHNAAVLELKRRPVTAQVAEYVRERILALRRDQTGQYENAACLRTNAMKFLPHYFRKGQLEKLFFLFPDPHFKVCARASAADEQASQLLSWKVLMCSQCMPLHRASRCYHGIFYTHALQAVNHRRRIIQHSLLTEYAHFLAIGGVIYTITDVKVGAQDVASSTARWLAGMRGIMSICCITLVLSLSLA